MYKLGVKFIKINSVLLEEEVYVVVKIFLLDGKEVFIIIKEKEIIVVDGDVVVFVLEVKENGEEFIIFKVIVENGIVKLKIKLCLKGDEDLKMWKEKLFKGKKEEVYIYIFKSENIIIMDDNKKKFVVIILNNVKEGK